MPEIGEVARVVHYLRKHLANRRIASILTTEDALVYNAKAKPPCTADNFSAALHGKKILDAKQQGKYFWLEMESPPHPLMHLGMTGWVKLSNESTYYKSGPENDEEGGEEVSDASVGSEKTAKRRGKGRHEEWPPRFMKFVLKMEGEPEVEAAFVDGRRLARIRLIDCAADQMRKMTPLKENGPDPVQDKDVLTVEWLGERMRKKKVPVKAFLLDQANISGVGNWVADEVLYNARLHPEQYTNSFSDEQIRQLHRSLTYVTGFACEVLSDSARFPEDWLFKHRWNAGKKGDDKNRLANGEKIVHIKVGGRTSAIVPSVQKKTGPVAADVNEDGDEVETGKASGATKKGRGGAVRKRKAEEEEEEEEEAEKDEDEDEDEESPKPTTKSTKTKTAKKAKSSPRRGRKAEDVEDEDDEDEVEDEVERPKATSKSTKAKAARAKTKKATKKPTIKYKDDEDVDDDSETDTETPKLQKRTPSKATPKSAVKSETTKQKKTETAPRRQSSRLQK